MFYTSFDFVFNAMKRKMNLTIYVKMGFSINRIFSIKELTF